MLKAVSFDLDGTLLGDVHPSILREALDDSLEREKRLSF